MQSVYFYTPAQTYRNELAHLRLFYSNVLYKSTYLIEFKGVNQPCYK